MADRANSYSIRFNVKHKQSKHRHIYVLQKRLEIIVKVVLNCRHLFLQWEKPTAIMELRTEVCAGCTSWFNTPAVTLPSTSYLEIKTWCDKMVCELEIFGSSRYCETVTCVHAQQIHYVYSYCMCTGYIMPQYPPLSHNCWGLLYKINCIIV